MTGDTGITPDQTALHIPEVPGNPLEYSANTADRARSDILSAFVSIESANNTHEGVVRSAGTVIEAAQRFSAFQEPLRVVQTTAEFRDPKAVESFNRNIVSNLTNLRSTVLALPSKAPIGQSPAKTRFLQERALIQREAKIGGGLLGEVPTGHYREFFNLDSRTWVWYEQWQDDGIHQMYTNYEFQPRGVLKIVNSQPRGYVEGKELTRLLGAMQTYHDAVAANLYQPTARAS